MTAAGAKVIQNAKHSGRWTEPAQTVDLSMPRELTERLRSNKKAASFFESLALSYRQQCIGWINTAKRSETKTRRLNEVISLLARGEKLGMR